MSELAAIADELYGLDPDNFTAARDTASRTARERGDRDLAAALKAMRRPTVGTWLVNQLVRQNSTELEEMLDLGDALRAAQRALDGNRLRALSRQRHQAVSALINAASAIATDADRTVSDAARREIEGTLDAALADADAARAVRSGRLMRPLTSSGLEAVDLTDTFAAPDDDVPARKARPVRAKPAPPPRAAKRAADAQAVRAAQAKVADAERAVSERESDLDAARAAVRSAKGEVVDLETALADAKTRQRTAEQQRRDADRDLKRLVRARDAARRALDAAKKG